ncbi:MULTISPECIES: hypothetical protein [unclassified Acinetobacter]|uniref:hypothetical protein n=1 Tax=unclassified Acinetobacter TaxID=196816 RepID=UPI0021B847E3|nr:MULTISPECIES: hypothetical protein [unclassified Acinetobacter]
MEQEFGRLFARYLNTKLPEDKKVEDARIFMAHEEIPETTFEEQRVKDLKKKSG